MRTVFTNDMVAHVWAQREQAEGRNARGSFFFERDTLYSYGYHFKVAEHRTAADGSAFVLFNANGYSTTTAQHKSLAARSIPGGVPVFTLPGELWDRPGDALAWYAAELEDVTGKAKRARKYADHHHRRAGELVAEANGYAAALGSSERLTLPETVAEAAALAAERAEAAQKSNAAAKLRALYGRLKDTHADYMAWRRGELVACPRPWADVAGSHLLTLSEDGETVRTSDGASFPADHARRAAAVVLRLLETGGAPARPVRLGHFQVSGAAGGVLAAGCHRVRAAEVRRLARRLAA